MKIANFSVESNSADNSAIEKEFFSRLNWRMIDSSNLPVAFTVGKYDNCFIESFSAMQCVIFDVECKFGYNTKFVYYISNIKIKESERAVNC